MALTQISTGMLASGDGTVDLNIDNGTFVVDVSTSRVGIGAAPTDGTLHVQTASAGTVAASTQADDIVIENNAEGGMTIITPDDQSARIRFTSPSTNNDVGGATIFYRQNINKMNIGTGVAGGVLSLQSGAANETMLLDGSGNVGIGTSPAYKLDVASPVIQFGDSTDAFAQYKSSAGNWHVGANSSNAFAFYSGTYGSGTERMRIDSAGNVGIGNNNPSAFNSLAGKHVVIGSGAEANTLTLFSDDTNDGNGYGHVAFADSNVSSSTAQYAGLIQYFHGDNSMRFYTGSLLRGRIDSTGTIISEKTSGIFFKNSSGGSNSTQVQISNGGGDMRAGVESSSGGAIQTGTSAYAAVFGNQANYPTHFTTNGTTKMTINADGIIVHNGVSTYSNSFFMTNNVTYTFDVPVGDEAGNGNVIEVHAMYDHFYNFGYGASLITLVGKRGVSVNRSDIKAITTGNGGSWTISAPNSSTLRLTKNAGTYPGGGYGHIMVRFRKS